MSTTKQESVTVLTAKDLSKQVGISLSSIYRKRSTGESLPQAMKISNGAIRWRQAEVDAWLEARLEPINN